MSLCAGKTDTSAPGARNVVLIVWDTVRASYLSLYGYQRDTTPNLAAWARKGVCFERAIAPAPWTFPSHSSFFTGQWPFRVNTQWQYTLDASHSTLAGYLSSRGYQTTAFVANIDSCNYETGLDRGFAHYEDFALTPRSLVSRSVGGRVDPRKPPEFRRLLREEVDRPPVPRRERDQRRLSRLAEPTAERSSLFCVPQLF